MAFAMILQARDHLRMLRDDDDREEWAVTPPQIPHPGLDTLLQALTHHEFHRLGLAVPPWAAAPEPLEKEWVLAAAPSRRSRVKARTPAYLADLGVYVSDRDLVTV